MAFKSHAQRDKMMEKVKAGTLSQEQFDEMAKDTPKDLPHRVTPVKPVKGPKEKPIEDQDTSDW